mgnify:CR=1 FL=1
MKIVKENLHLPEGKFNVEVLKFEKEDRSKLYSIYNDWRGLCEDLYAIEARGVNLPEGLSESSFCLEMDYFRITKSISGVNTSFDAYDPNSYSRVQVKACSVLPDLTSFGPKSVWDKLYFVDFYRGGEWNGKFDIYLIENSFIYNHNVNKNQTFKEQQDQKRRPRFSIYKEIIKKNLLKPFKTGDLSKLK